MSSPIENTASCAPLIMGGNTMSSSSEENAFAICWRESVMGSTSTAGVCGSGET